VSRSVLGVAPVLSPILRESVADPEAMPDRLVARYLAPYVGRDGMRHLLTLARSIRESEVDELELDTVTAPTLVIWGEQDRFLDVYDGDRLARAIPGARLERLPGVGRLVPEEAPEELAGLLHHFAGAAPATPAPA